MKSLLPLSLSQTSETTIHCCTPSPITFNLKTTSIQHRLTNHKNQVQFISLPSHFNLPRKLILSQRKQYRTNIFISACIRRNAEKETIQTNIWTHNKFLKYIDFSRKLLSGIVVLYLFGGVVLIGDSSSYENVFSCEDVDRYYVSVDHKEGEELMRELNTITSPHVALSYEQVWEAIKILDAADDDNPEASSDVVEIYSLRGVSKLLAGKPEGWNREHLWPRSYGLTDGPSLTDLHNIRPADVNVNSSRGNKYYGECLAHSTHCLKPANKEAAYDTETDKKIWAPPLQVRGDIARSLMYMATTYGFHQSDGSQNLRLSDSPSVENREMGLLSTLLKWNELDPPSRTEELRNNRVCKLYQHNRNPFVDHPEYANLIWKPHTPTTITSQKNYTARKAWINEFHYNNKGKDKNEFVEVAVRSSVDASRLKIALYNGANGRMYESLSLADRSIFNVTEGSPELLIYTVHVPLQNGRGDGIALFSQEDEDVEMLEFISCQGVVKAINGPADGITSVDIGIQETDGSGEIDSLGLSGGDGQFTWRKFKNEASPGRPNMGQML